MFVLHLLSFEALIGKPELIFADHFTGLKLYDDSCKIYSSSLPVIFPAIIDRARETCYLSCLGGTDRPRADPRDQNRSPLP